MEQPGPTRPSATRHTPGTRSDREPNAAIEQLSLDLGDLLSGAAQRAAEATGATSAVAWALDTNGVGFAAARFGVVDDTVPEAETLAELFALTGATDLRAAGVQPSLFALSHARELRAAVPISRNVQAAPLSAPAEESGSTSADEAPQPAAVLLLGFPPSEAVRPRSLAILDRIARRLQTSVTTALAVARLTKLDAEVLRMTHLATLGDLLAEVVHEVRNPLVSVKTFLQMLPGHLDDPDFHTNFRTVVLDETRRMERLLDTLLHHARPDPRAVSTRDAALGTTIESVGRLLEKRALAKDLTLVIDVAADLPEAAIAEDALRQIILNLALNAFEATPEQGTVRLTAEHGTEAQPGVALIVDDQGAGIAEEERALLFDPFFSTRPDRPVGLGLTVTAQLAREAGGAIHVESAPGGGARFRVWLPTA